MANLKELLASPKLVLGTWSQSASPEMLEIVGYSNFDFTIIDTEHGYFGLETAENLVRAAEAAGIIPIVRVAVNETHLIMKSLDIGAHGVVVPQITNRDEAQKAVRAARYSPQGMRGACPCIRAGQHLVRDWDRFSAKSNRECVVILLVEGVDGMKNICEIISTDGLDAVMLGPFDLSVSLGVGGQLDHPLVVNFMTEMVGLCREHNVEFFVPNFDLELESAKNAIDRWRALGCTNFTIGTDKLLFADYMSKFNKHVRAE
jgi:4-hydroxy-2-oxoheptanedioate aldolase